MFAETVANNTNKTSTSSKIKPEKLTSLQRHSFLKDIQSKNSASIKALSVLLYIATFFVAIICIVEYVGNFIYWVFNMPTGLFNNDVRTDGFIQSLLLKIPGLDDNLCAYIYWGVLAFFSLLGLIVSIFLIFYLPRTKSNKKIAAEAVSLYVDNLSAGINPKASGSISAHDIDAQGKFIKNSVKLTDSQKKEIQKEISSRNRTTVKVLAALEITFSLVLFTIVALDSLMTIVDKLFGQNVSEVGFLEKHLKDLIGDKLFNIIYSSIMVAFSAFLLVLLQITIFVLPFMLPNSVIAKDAIDYYNDSLPPEVQIKVSSTPAPAPVKPNFSKPISTPAPHPISTPAVTQPVVVPATSQAPINISVTSPQAPAAPVIQAAPLSPSVPAGDARTQTHGGIINFSPKIYVGSPVGAKVSKRKAATTKKVKKVKVLKIVETPKKSNKKTSVESPYQIIDITMPKINWSNPTIKKNISHFISNGKLIVSKNEAEEVKTVIDNFLKLAKDKSLSNITKLLEIVIDSSSHTREQIVTKALKIASKLHKEKISDYTRATIIPATPGAKATGKVIIELKK